MTNSYIQPSLSGGELSPRMFGRVDFDKYRSGLSVSRNFFVDVRGGVSTRPGTEFNGAAPDQSACPCLIPFVFSEEQTYDLLLGDGAMWIVQDDGFLVEDAIEITAGTAANPLALTIPDADYDVGDVISFSDVVGFDRANDNNGLEGRQLKVASVVSDVYTFVTVFDDAVDATTWTAFVSGDASRLYKVDAPWASDVLFDLIYAQSADVITVTHNDYPEYQIQRFGALDWRISQKTYGSFLAAPTGLVAAAVNNPGTTEQFFYIYGVTVTDPDTNEESIPSTVAVINGALNQNTGVANQLAWDTIAGKVYRIYEAERAPNGSENSDGPWFLSFIGTANSPPWNDTNIAPETSIVPPSNKNPFQSGAFSSALVTQAGFGYIDPIVVIEDTTGSGGMISLAQSTAGAITGTTVETAGMDYSAPVLTVTENDTVAGTGAGVAFDDTWQAFAGGFIPDDGSLTITGPGSHYHVPYVTLTPVGAAVFTEGLAYISCVSGVPTTLHVLQQPFVFDTTGVTLTIVLADSLPGLVIASSLATVRGILSSLTNPAVNSYFLQRHVLAASLNNPAGFWLTRPGLYSNLDTSFPSQANDAITGTIVGQEVNSIVSLTPMSFGLIALTRKGAYQISGGSPGAALTPTNITAQAQAFSGASALRPLRIDSDLLYETARGSAIRDLTYNYYVSIYTGEDISVLAEHLFRGRRLRQWAWAEEPYKLIHAVRNDGILLMCTYQKTEKVFGWTRHDTQGFFKSVSVTPHTREDRARYVVRRPLANGAFGYFVERMAERFFDENYGLNTPPDPETPWCVDCGVAYLPQNGPADVELSLVSLETQGQIGTPVIVTGGADYTDDSFVQILDNDPDGGSGAEGTLTTVAGAITALTISAPGAGYISPYVVLGDGTGAVVYLPVLNRAIFQTSSAFLTDDYEGWVLRTCGGKGTVVDVISNDQFEIDIDVMFTAWVPNTEAGVFLLEPQIEGQWTLTEPKTLFGGLDHLEGKQVAILADGAVVEPQTVAEGAITLTQAASYVIAGLGFTAQARTLRMDLGGQITVQGKRKSLNAVTVRVADTTGLAVGPTFDNLAEIEPDVPEMETAIPLGNTLPTTDVDGTVNTGIPFFFSDTRQVVDGGWSEDGVLCIQQSYPRPATILALIPEFDIGDN